MATTYNTAFGSLPGYNELLGTTNTTGGGQQQTYGQTTQTSTTRPPYQAAQTFAQMQRQGVARPAPPTAPQAQPFAQYGGSQQAQQMRQRLQEQLQQFGQAPSRFDTQAFQQIRGAQAANLQQEYQGQLQALNEELARRGLSASSVGGGRMGDLAGQQARALASLDAELLQRAAETQAQDRAQLLAAQQGLAELASAQDLAQFEANRVAQAATFENQLRAAQFGQQQYEQAGQEAFQGAQAEEAARQAERQFGLQATGQAANLSLELQRLLGQQEIERAQLTGELGDAQTLAARQFESQRELERAQLTGRLGTGATAQDTLAAQQFALQEELQRAGLTGRLGEGATAQDTLAAQQQQFQQRQVLYQQAQQMSQQSGVQYTVNERGEVVPLRDAQGNVVRTSDFTQAEEARKLQSEELTLRRQLGLMEATGQGLTVNERGEVVPATGTAAQTLQARQLAYQNAARLSEQSGVQYTVKADGTVDVLRDAQGNPVRTSAFTQAEEARKQQQEQFNIAQFGKAGTIQTGTQTLAALQQALQQAGVTGKFEGQLTQEALQNAYARAAQLTQATGQQHTVDPNTGTITAGSSTLEARLREAGITGTFGGALTQEALQNAYARAAQLSQITGQQYTVDPKEGKIVAATGEAGRTFAAQLQAAGITGQFGGAMTQEALQNAYARAAQLTQATGLQHTVDPKTGAITAGAATEQSVLQRAELTGTLGGSQTLAALQQALQNAQFLTAQTGNLYEVNTLTGKLEAKGSTTIAGQMASFEQAQQLAQQRMAATGRQFAVTRDPKTGMYSVAEQSGDVTAPEAQQAFNRALLRAQQLEQTTGFQYEPKFNEATQQWETSAVLDPSGKQRTSESGRRFDLEQNLRAYLGLTEASGLVYDPLTGALQRTATGLPQETVQGQIARSQTLMALANSLGNLTPEQIAQLLGKASPTPTGGGGGGTTTTPPTNPKDGDRKTEGGKTYVYRGTWPTGQWVEITSTTTTTGDTKPTQPTTTTTPKTDITTTTTKTTETLTPVPDAYKSQLPEPMFTGQYRLISGLGWVRYMNGSWQVTSVAPTSISTSTPGGGTISAYPGTTIFENGAIYVWNGSRWLS